MSESKRALDLVDRLRGVYTLDVDDGAGLLRGSGTVTRAFDTPPIQKEAAAEIERLRALAAPAPEKYDPNACELCRAVVGHERLMSVQRQEDGPRRAMVCPDCAPAPETEREPDGWTTAGEVADLAPDDPNGTAIVFRDPADARYNHDLTATGPVGDLIPVYINRPPPESEAVKAFAAGFHAAADIAGIEGHHYIYGAVKSASDGYFRALSPEQEDDKPKWAWTCADHGHFEAEEHQCPKCPPSRWRTDPAPEQEGES